VLREITSLGHVCKDGMRVGRWRGSGSSRKFSLSWRNVMTSFTINTSQVTTYIIAPFDVLFSSGLPTSSRPIPPYCPYLSVCLLFSQWYVKVA
jgi:hypothetical protein